jgi:integrase
VVRVAETLSERDDGTLSGGSTKSDAGRRTVAIPVVIVPDLAAHLAEFVAPNLDAVVFLGENGGRLRRSNFRRATHWSTTVASVGLAPDFHFHDLGHTGNQLAAEAGATTKRSRELIVDHGRRAGRVSQRWVVQDRRIRLRTVMIASARSKKASITRSRRS